MGALLAPASWAGAILHPATASHRPLTFRAFRVRASGGYRTPPIPAPARLPHCPLAGRPHNYIFPLCCYSIVVIRVSGVVGLSGLFPRGISPPRLRAGGSSPRVGLVGLLHPSAGCAMTHAAIAAPLRGQSGRGLKPPAFLSATALCCGVAAFHAYRLLWCSSPSSL